MKNYVFALLSIGAILLYACDKDDDKKSDDPNSNVQLVTSATWKYDTVGIDTDNDGKINQALPAGYGVASCDKDNTITFKSDSTGVLNAGATKCNTGDPQTTNFKWWFKDNGATIYTPDNVFSAGVTGDFKVGELTATKFRIIKDYPSPIGTVKLVLELKH